MRVKFSTLLAFIFGYLQEHKLKLKKKKQKVANERRDEITKRRNGYLGKLLAHKLDLLARKEKIRTDTKAGIIEILGNGKLKAFFNAPQQRQVVAPLLSSVVSNLYVSTMALIPLKLLRVLTVRTCGSS